MFLDVLFVVVVVVAESRKKYLLPFYCKNANVNKFHSLLQ